MSKTHLKQQVTHLTLSFALLSEFVQPGVQQGESREEGKPSPLNGLQGLNSSLNYFASSYPHLHVGHWGSSCRVDGGQRESSWRTI